MPASEEFPDSTFVEDTAVLTPEFAVITNPGAESRNEETVEIEEVLKEFYKKLLLYKSTWHVRWRGYSTCRRSFLYWNFKRTNEEGAHQLKEIVESEGYKATIVPLENSST